MTNIAKLIQQHNNVLNLLRFYKGIDKSDISRRLQLSIPTIYSAIDDLIKEKILLKDTQKSIKINNTYGTLVGISIGTSLCKVCFLNFDFSLFSPEEFSIHKQTLIQYIDDVSTKKNLLNKCHKDTKKNYIYFDTPDTLYELKQILNSVFVYIQNCVISNSLNVISIGISCTGIINDKMQRILSASNLSYLDTLTLDTLIYPGPQNFLNENQIHMCLVQNSNASIIAEKVNLYQTNSVYKNKSNIVSLFLDFGIGNGIYLGKLFTGTSGYAGEISHIQAPYYETSEEMLYYKKLINSEIISNTCTCGCNNCYDYKMRSYVFEMSEKDFCNMSSEEIKNFLTSHPDKAKLFGKYLGSMINTLTSLLNIDLIVLTGKLNKSMHLLSTHIDATLDENPLKHSRTDCKICTSALGSLAPAIGAAIYAYHKKYDIELSWEY